MCSDKKNIKDMLASKNISQTIYGIIHRYRERSKQDEKDMFFKDLSNIERSVKTKVKIIEIGCDDIISYGDLITKDYETSQTIIQNFSELFEKEAIARERAIDELLGIEKGVK